MTNYRYAELQRVPFLIKIPGVEGLGTVDEYAGQVDVMPTFYIYLVSMHKIISCLVQICSLKVMMI